MSTKLKPFINIGPGQIIKRNLESLNWNSKDLSEIIGMSEKSVSQMMNNKQSITVETARLLSKAFNTSPEFWLNLEQNYRLREKSEGRREEETGLKAEIRKYMPILEMKKKKWIECDKTVKSQETAYKKFWNTKTIDFAPYQNGLGFCARQSKTNEDYTKYYSITWFQKARTEVAKIKVGTYSKEKLTTLAGEISRFTLLPGGIDKFISELNKCGVKFIVLSHLQKTFLDGAAFFDDKNPVIVYTARYDRVDNFWWTVAHEIAHVLLHLKNEKDCFLDNLEDRTDINVREQEADKMAGKLLNVSEIIAKAEQYKNYFTESRLKEVAEAVQMDSSVVIGILKHHHVVDYRTLPKYRKTVLNLIGIKCKCG